MKISWNHLQSYFSDVLNKDLVLERLTMAGLEVEDETPVAPFFSGVVVSQVVECNKHPDADKLSLCKVDVGHGELLQIICGAPNVAVGVKVPCAKVGAVLPGDFQIAERKMRGIVSHGMLCSGDELGCPDGVDGLLLLASDAPIGQDIRDYLDLNDSIIEFKITPNRGDCLSYLGLAREISALTDYQLKTKTTPFDYLIKQNQSLSLVVSNPDLCPNYIGLAIKQVNNQVKSPAWLTKILERSGVRSISAVVDISNYVMLNLGQPLHAFDLTSLAGGIQVRLAKAGETLQLLDGTLAKLNANSLLIANKLDEPLAIAGVMGGLSSSVTLSTTELMIESAFFVPDAIHGRARQYEVSSDAAFRYERGVDPAELQRTAINLAAGLITEVCGGVVADYIHFTDKKHSTSAKPINLFFANCDALIGEKIKHEQIIKILQKLGCQTLPSPDSEEITVNVPSYRFDLKIKQDLIEEIIRVYGYDRIKAQMPVLPHTFNSLDINQARLQQFKQIMLGFGFNEVVSYAFIDEKYSANFADPGYKLVRLQNSIAGLNVMRNNLIAGLIKSLQYNVNRGCTSARLFELARVFHGEAANQQPLYLSGLIYGKIAPHLWANDSRSADFFDLRLIVEELLSGFGKLNFAAQQELSLCHPGRCAGVILNDVVIGFLGQLHPRFLPELGLDDLPYLFELNLESFAAKVSFELQPPSKYQKVSRDLAFVLNKQVAVGEILQQIQQLDITELVLLNVFDVFQGGSLAADEKSVAFNLVFQADKTLSDEEVNTKLDLIKAQVINNFAAKLR